MRFENKFMFDVQVEIILKNDNKKSRIINIDFCPIKALINVLKRFYFLIS